MDIDTAAPLATGDTKTSNIKVKLNEASGYLQRLNALPPLPIKAEYSVMRIVESLEIEVARQAKIEVGIYKDLGVLTVGDDGLERHIVPEEGKSELVRRVMESRTMEVELPFYPIPEAHLVGCREPLVLRGLHLFFSTEIKDPDK